MATATSEFFDGLAARGLEPGFARTTGSIRFDLNRDDLDRIYKEAGGTGAEALRTIDVGVIEHGELGPILVNLKYKNRISKKPEGEKLKDRLDPQKLFNIQKKIVDDFDRKVREGKTPQFDIDYHRRQLARLAKELGIAIDEAA